MSENVDYSKVLQEILFHRFLDWEKVFDLADIYLHYFGNALIIKVYKAEALIFLEHDNSLANEIANCDNPLSLDDKFSIGKALDLLLEKSRAYIIFKELADLGHPLSQNMIGHYFDVGTVVARNPLTAFSYYERSARNLCTIAIKNMGISLEYGEGTSIDNIKAYECYEKAAVMGDFSCAIFCGVFHAVGKLNGGVNRDCNDAMKYFKTSLMKCGRALKHVPCIYQNRELVETAITQNPLSYCVLDECSSFRNDKSIVLLALNRSHLTLGKIENCLSKQMRNEKEVFCILNRMYPTLCPSSSFADCRFLI